MERSTVRQSCRLTPEINFRRHLVAIDGDDRVAGQVGIFKGRDKRLLGFIYRTPLRLRAGRMRGLDADLIAVVFADAGEQVLGL